MWFNGYETKDGKFEIAIVRQDNIVTVSSRNEKKREIPVKENLVTIEYEIVYILVICDR